MKPRGVVASKEKGLLPARSPILWKIGVVTATGCGSIYPLHNLFLRPVTFPLLLHRDNVSPLNSVSNPTQHVRPLTRLRIRHTLSTK